MWFMSVQLVGRNNNTQRSSQDTGIECSLDICQHALGTKWGGSQCVDLVQVGLLKRIIQPLLYSLCRMVQATPCLRACILFSFHSLWWLHFPAELPLRRWDYLQGGVLGFLGLGILFHYKCVFRSATALQFYWFKITFSFNFLFRILDERYAVSSEPIPTGLKIRSFPTDGSQANSRTCAVCGHAEILWAMCVHQEKCYFYVQELSTLMCIFNLLGQCPCNGHILMNGSIPFSCSINECLPCCSRCVTEHLSNIISFMCYS